MSGPDLTEKSYWDQYYETADLADLAVSDDTMDFRDVFERHLEHDRSRSVLEIGCANGKYLGYLHRRYGYEPHGVDFSEGIRLTGARFATAGLAPPTLHQADLFTWSPGRLYDLVCSFGFAEHFDDFPLTMRRHADLVAPGGLMIVTMPHFHHLQYPLHWLLDRDNLRRHNVSSMRRSAVRAAMAPLPFDVLELAYYGTFEFWTEEASPPRWHRVATRAVQLAGAVATRVVGRQRPNPLFSPHLYLVARRQGG